MWNPGFPYEDAIPAELVGYHRAFCVYSVYYRGTPARPGLVLGLDRGGVCEGVAFRISAKHAFATLRYLRAREQITGVYRETAVPVRLKHPGVGSVLALTFVVERGHPGYARALPLARQAQLIRAAAGSAGANLDYALSTIEHLRMLGCETTSLARLVAALGPVFRRPSAASDHRLVRPGSGLTLHQQLRTMPHPAPRIRVDQRKRFGFRDQLAAHRDEKWKNAR